MIRDLSLRLTHRYVGEYQHEDEWRTIGFVDVLREIRLEPDDEGNPANAGTSIIMALCIDVIARDKIEQALIDTFSRHGCACEHDCCGCVSRAVIEAKPVTGDLWKLKVGLSRNY